MKSAKVLVSERRLLMREEFKEQVFAGSGGRCVICGKPAVDAHHVLDRKLYADGGYYAGGNGAAVCDQDHWRCETTEISVEEVRKAAGILVPVLPEGFLEGISYDKWGNRCWPSGMRSWGPLEHDTGARRALRMGGFLGLLSCHGTTASQHLARQAQDNQAKELFMFMTIGQLDHVPYPQVPKELLDFAETRGVNVGPFFGLPAGGYHARRNTDAAKYLGIVGFHARTLREIAAYLYVLPPLDQADPLGPPVSIADRPHWPGGKPPVRGGEPFYADAFAALVERAEQMGFFVNLARYADDAQLISVVRKDRLIDRNDFYFSRNSSSVMHFLNNQASGAN